MWILSNNHKKQGRKKLTAYRRKPEQVSFSWYHWAMSSTHRQAKMLDMLFVYTLSKDHHQYMTKGMWKSQRKTDSMS